MNARRLVDRFLRASEAEVLKTFGRLPGAQVHEKFVYLPGTRVDRVLLVAHADTVREHDPAAPGSNPIWLGDVAVGQHHEWFGSNSTFGGSYSIGADDRAGCAALYSLHDGSHSVLITTGEESGGKGAEAALDAYAEELAKHVFAVEIDRRGCRQAVFYDVGTHAFERWMLERLGEYDPDKLPWSKQHGSCTDIKWICKEVGICGVNLAAGYWDEHRADEMLWLGAWDVTRRAVKGLLAQPEIQQWKLPPPPPKPVQKQKTLPRGTGRSYGSVYDPDAGGWRDWEGPVPNYEEACIYPFGMATKLGQRKLILGTEPNTKELHLAPKIGVHKARKLVALIDHWKQKGVITVDEAIMAFGVIRERSPNLQARAEASETPFERDAALLVPEFASNSAKCPHWCEKCEPHHIWRHMRMKDGICLTPGGISSKALCPMHTGDPMDVVHNFKFVMHMIVRDPTPCWATMLATRRKEMSVPLWQQYLACLCGHARVHHSHVNGKPGNCLMSGGKCPCVLYQPVQAEVRKLPVAAEGRKAESET